MPNPNGSAFRGLYKYLQPEQREALRAAVARVAPPDHRNDSALKSWHVYRSPTTGDAPRTLRLHRRGPNGELLEVVSITENGVTPVR